MEQIVNDKISEIEKYLEDLYSFVPSTFEEYKNDVKTKAACEHYFEKIVESLADLSFLIIKQKNLRLPKDDIDAFFVLSKNDIISNELAEKLKDAKGMRNILAHEYGTVNDEIIFEAITEELESDVRKFIENIKT